MRRPVLATAMVLAGLALIWGSGSPAAACSLPQQTPTERQFLDRADVVFEGVYVSSRDPSAGAAVMSNLDPIFYTFAADRVLKGGSVSSQAVVASARDGASCGASFTAGVRYRVYARNVSGSLVTDSVSGNQPVPLAATTTTVPQTPAPPASPKRVAPRFTG